MPFQLVATLAIWVCGAVLGSALINSISVTNQVLLSAEQLAQLQTISSTTDSFFYSPYEIVTTYAPGFWQISVAVLLLVLLVMMVGATAIVWSAGHMGRRDSRGSRAVAVDIHEAPYMDSDKPKRDAKSTKQRKAQVQAMIEQMSDDELDELAQLQQDGELVSLEDLMRTAKR
jgi:hypothetical protein